MSNQIQSVVVVLGSVLVAGGVAWAAGTHGVEALGMPVPVLCAGLAFVMNWVAFVPAFAGRTERYYDLVGSLTYLTLTCVALAYGARDARTWLLAGMIAVWALRLGSYLFLRIHRAGSDRRFDQVKQDFGQFLMAWTLQALWVFLTLCCALAAMTHVVSRPPGIWAEIGAFVWVTGFGIEVVADRQKKRFRADPANRDRFITGGLWAWSRHPNYFGEFVLWVGIAMIALPALSGWQHVTLVSPVFVYLLLTRISGIPPLEERADEKWGDEPAYRAYVANTTVFWPWPPS